MNTPKSPELSSSLQPLTAAFLECVTTADVVSVIVERAMVTLGARAGVVAVLSDDVRVLKVVGAHGYRATTLDGWDHFPLSAPLPLSDAVRKNTPLYFATRAALEIRYPALIPVLELEPESAAAVTLPLSARQRVFGGLYFSFETPREFPAEERVFLEELARQSSLALERALFLEELEKARQQQEFLSRASAILGESLDYVSRFEQLARLCIPELADWATVDILSDDGFVVRLATAHRTLEGERIMREIQQRFPPEAQRNESIRTVIERGETFLVPNITDDMLLASGMDPEHARLLLEIGFTSVLCLPLRTRDRKFGAISMGFGADTSPKRTFSPPVVQVAEELSRRAAIAVDNARLFETTTDAQRNAENVLESISEEFYALDAANRFTYVNHRAAEVWQRDRDSLVGRNIWEIFPTANQGPIYEAQEQAMRERRSVHFEAVSPVRQSWVEGTVHPAEDGGISVYLRDIGGRKHAEEAREAATTALRLSEERYRRLLDTAMEGVLFLDIDANITHANTRMAHMLCYHIPDVLIGLTAYDLLFPEDIQSARERWVTRLQGRHDEIEARLRRSDNTECWVIAHVSIERDEQTGVPIGTFSMFTDITERKRALREVQAKSTEVTSILESITDAFFAVDTNWCFTYLNNEAERVLLRERGDLLGKSVWKEFPAAVGQLFDLEYHRAMRDQVPVSFEAYYPPPLDTWFDVRAYPSSTGLSVYFRNVNAERRAKEERERLLTEQQRLVRELQEASIRQRRFLREMLFGFTEGRLRLCDTPADLPSPLSFVGAPVFLTSVSLRTLRHAVAAAAKRMQMPLERIQDLETAVGEASMNAVRHGGGGTAEVHVDAARGVVQIWVQDRGAGIAEEMIHRALERGWTTGGFGHGFFLMLKTCDRIWLLTGTGGTTLVIEQDREEAKPPWLQSAGKTP